VADARREHAAGKERQLEVIGHENRVVARRGRGSPQSARQAAYTTGPSDSAQA
jgi:hypothetical protein